MTASKLSSISEQCHVSVEFKEGLSTEKVVEKISRLSNPQIIIWYIGAKGLRQTAVQFYRDTLLEPILKRADNPRFWLVDLTAWGAFKDSNCSINSSHSCCDIIEKIPDNRIRCIKSAEIFRRMQMISDPSIIDYFTKALNRDFIKTPSKDFPEKNITVGEIFSNKCPIMKNLYKQDVGKTYSVFQYLEGCLLIEEILSNLSTFETEPQIVFAIPNDEIKYYKDEFGSFHSDIEFLISKHFQHLTTLTINFFAFQYGDQVTHRPYNAPGKTLNKNNLHYYDMVGNQTECRIREELLCIH